MFPREKTIIHWALVVGVLTLAFATEYSWRKPKEKPAPYLSYQGLPFTILNKPRAGELITMDVDRCNNTSEVQHYVVTANLISLSHPAPPTVMTTDYVDIYPGCHKGHSERNRAPISAKPGLYQLDGYGIDDNKNAVHWYSKQFEIVADR